MLQSTITVKGKTDWRKGEGKMTIRELEILKSALECDIGYQRDSPNKDKPAFKAWLEDSEKLLKKVSRKLSVEKTKQAFIGRIEEQRNFDFK